jgi:hypothetical protein
VEGDGVDWRALNPANWDDRVPVHLASSFYDLAVRHRVHRDHTDGPALEHTRQVEFQHSLGEIVTSLAEEGLRIEFLHEYDFDAFGRFDSLQRREDGTYRFPPGQPRVPMQFSLRASTASTG